MIEKTNFVSTFVDSTQLLISNESQYRGLKGKFWESKTDPKRTILGLKTETLL